MPVAHPLLVRSDNRYATPSQVIRAVEQMRKHGDMELLDMAANIVMSWAFEHNIPEGHPVDLLDALRAGSISIEQAYDRLKDDQ